MFIPEYLRLEKSQFPGLGGKAEIIGGWIVEKR